MAVTRPPARLRSSLKKTSTTPGDCDSAPHDRQQLVREGGPGCQDQIETQIHRQRGRISTAWCTSEHDVLVEEQDAKRVGAGEKAERIISLQIPLKDVMEEGVSAKINSD